MNSAEEQHEETAWLTVREVAERCSRTPRTVRNWIRGIRCGSVAVKLNSESCGKCDRITEDALASFKEACHRSKYGEPTPKPPMSKAKIRRQVERDQEELMALLGRTA